MLSPISRTTSTPTPVKLGSPSSSPPLGEGGVTGLMPHAPLGADGSRDALNQEVQDKGCASRLLSGTCVTDPQAKYMLPSSTSAFYTTWSFYMCLIAAGLTVFYLIVYGIYGSSSSQFAGLLNSEDPNRSGWIKFLQFFVPYVMVPLIIWGAVNSLGVLATSQQFLAFNFMQSVDFPDVDAEGQIKGMSLKFADYIFIDNFFVHIVPALIAIVILLLLCTGKFGPRVNRWGVVGACFIAMALFLLIYFVVPLKEDGKNYFFLDKVAKVYNNPKWYLFAVQLVIVVLALFLIPLYMLGDSSPFELTAPK